MWEDRKIESNREADIEAFQLERLRCAVEEQFIKRLRDVVTNSSLVSGPMQPLVTCPEHGEDMGADCECEVTKEQAWAMWFDACVRAARTKSCS